MKKFLFSGICVLAIVTVAVLNIKIDLGSQSSTLSLFSLANIDALAGGELMCRSRTPTIVGLVMKKLIGRMVSCYNL